MPSDFTPLTAGKQAPPAALSVEPDNIPAELKQRRQWVVWRYEWAEDRGDWAKIPHNPKTGGNAKPNNPSTWGDFDIAWRAYETGAWAGVGYVFAEDDPFVGVDLDDCRNPETRVVEPWAASILAELATYAEISPSGTGFKAIARGTWPVSGKRQGDIEVYRSGRYFALTGHVWLYDTIADAQPALDALWAKIGAEEWPHEGHRRGGSRQDVSG